MENTSGKKVDLYIPRKCDASNRIITAKDHASVQFQIPHVDKDGHLNGQFTTVAFCGFVRGQGRSDAALNKIAQEKGLVNAFPEYETKA